MMLWASLIFWARFITRVAFSAFTMEWAGLIRLISTVSIAVARIRVVETLIYVYTYEANMIIKVVFLETENEGLVSHLEIMRKDLIIIIISNI